MDGETLIAAIKHSLAGAALPDTYKAMCRQCGGVVQHSLDHAEAVPCGKGHQVAPTIARAALVRREIPAAPVNPTAPRLKRAMSPRAKIRAHNSRVAERAFKPRGGK